jgi:beta-phosphoglucomutase-like phosphatase (HAD superfamily)
MPDLLLLDLDGTLIDTPHYEAWNLAISALGLRPITVDEYIESVAGRPRYDGALSILKAENSLTLDSQLLSDAKRLGDQKQIEFSKISHKTNLFGDATRLLDRLSTQGQKTILYTASLNAAKLFETASSKISGLSTKNKRIVTQKTTETRGEMFRRILGSISPNNAALIDDATYAVETAAEMGIHSYHICRSTSGRKLIPKVEILKSLDDYLIG